MQTKILKLSFVFFCIILSHAKAQQTQQKPNIIVFLVDDMGWQDTAVPFWDKVTPSNKLYHTPNMQRLANIGLKFTNAYATPVCTPTRVSLMTGVNAAKHRVTNWTAIEKGVNSDYPQDNIFNSVAWNLDGLSPYPNIPNTFYATPLPKLLQQAGYYTVHCGKAHFASKDTPAENPLNLGFDTNIAGSATGTPASYLSENEYGNLSKNGQINNQAVPGLQKYYHTQTFLTEALTQEAIATLEKSKDKPFFLYMAQYAVHIPFEADERFVDKYKKMGLSKGEAAYASLIEGMDKSLGDLMDWLDQNNSTNNTVIIFMSDNGGLSRVPPRTGIAHTQNYPLKAGKGSVYEGGIRVPMIVSWPGIVKPASVTKRYLLIEDFFPTLLDIANITNPKTVQVIDGKSFMPTLKNPNITDKKRVLIWHYPNKWVPEDAPGISWFSALRLGNWKLVYNYKNQKPELYNLQNDISEEHNLAYKNPKKTLHLTRLLSTYLKNYKAQLPIDKLTSKPVNYPSSTQINLTK